MATSDSDKRPRNVPVVLDKLTKGLASAMPRSAVCQNTLGNSYPRLKSPSTKPSVDTSARRLTDCPPGFIVLGPVSASSHLSTHQHACCEVALLPLPMLTCWTSHRIWPKQSCPTTLPVVVRKSAVLGNSDLQRLEVYGPGLAERRGDQTLSTAQHSAGMFRARESPPRRPL